MTAHVFKNSHGDIRVEYREKDASISAYGYGYRQAFLFWTYFELHQFRSFERNKGYGSKVLAAFYKAAKDSGYTMMCANVYPDRDCEYSAYLTFLSKIGFTKISGIKSLFWGPRTVCLSIPNERGDEFLKKHE